VKRPLSSPKRAIDSKVKSIDETLLKAGLVRGRRRSAPGVSTLARELCGDPTTKQELAEPAPTPSQFQNGIELLQIPTWRETKSLKWLCHGFSTRRGGVSRAYRTENGPGELNLGFTVVDDREAVEQNRKLLAEAVSGNANTPLVSLRQFHSNLVVIASEQEAKRGTPRKADGAITATPGILLAIQTADCVPVLVADRKRRVVAAFHAGWRGTVKRIVELGIGRMQLEFGCHPEDMIAAIGPCVGQCCYAVGEEVLSEFESQFVYARDLFCEVFDSDPVRQKYPMLFLTQRAPGHSAIGPALHLDLVAANRRQLLDAGLKHSAVSVTGGCTSCQTDLFFSHRASRGHAGRMMSVIGIRG
jgi:hypothetical protein